MRVSVFGLGYGGSVSAAHFEHTVALGEHGPEVLTLPW